MHVQARLWQVGQLMPSRLRKHMEEQGALPVLYASSWLLTAFSSDFPLFFSARVMDVILADCYLEPMMKVSLRDHPGGWVGKRGAGICFSTSDSMLSGVLAR